MSAASTSEAEPGAPDDDARYRLLVNSITDYAIYMLDTDGRVASWNGGAERLKGYSRTEALGRNFADFYTAEDRAAGLPGRALETAAREGRFENEGWRVRKDASRFWAGVVIDPILDRAGDLIGYANITRDLTERRAAENALHNSEEQFRLLVGGVTDYAIYMLDPSGRVASWNAGAERIKGYRDDEIVGQHFSQFYTDEDRAAGVPEQSLETARREGRIDMEGWRVRKDGTRFMAHVVIDAIHDDHGDLVGFAKVTRDITERQATQAALAEAREALFQAQKMEAIGQLTGGIAHDFNNLLMAILSSLELARRRLPEDPHVRRLIDNATLAAERGATLTQRMLAFARRQELKREAIDVPALVLGMADLLERSLSSAITVETRFPMRLPAVETDASQLETALLNLAVNARDAMPDGGTITIGARAETVSEGDAGDLAPGPYVRLSVTDTGQGMDKLTLDRATEPFFTTKGIGKGTGLGLSMIHGLATQSGGALRIESEPGRGTTVALWLPAAAKAPVAETAPPPEALAASTRSLTVLAVDDDELVLLNTAAMLEELGHTAISVSSAAAALDVLRSQSVDMVITDQSMPGMTGAQLADEVARCWPDVRLVLATGYADLPPGVGENLARLAKPFGQRDLAKAIDARA